MELILFGLAAIGAWSLFKANTARGLRTVRCYVYHTALDDGASPEDANQLANSISTDVDTAIILDAKRYVALCFGGKQLSMIGAAKVRGFIEQQKIKNQHVAKPSVSDCGKQAQINLTKAAQDFVALGEDFLPLSVDTFKYASGIKMRPDHIPTILGCMGWAYQNAEAVTNSQFYSAKERKQVKAIAANLR